jgi:glycosyltransferase involved in cell wall biosynthesis
MSGTRAPRGLAPDRHEPAADGEAVVLETRVVCGSGGGPDKTILNTPRFLASTRYRTLCAYMHPPGDPGFEQIKARALAWGAPLLSIPDRGPLDWRVVAELARVCRRERVAIWHGHDYKSNLLGLLLRRRHPMRLVTTVHGWVRHTERTPLYYGLDRYSLRHYERVICVSEDLRDRCLASGVPERRCVLIENAIDAEYFSRAVGIGRDEARRRLGIAPGRLVVGAVGRLSPEKGFDVLIRAADRLVASGVDLEVLIAGEGDDESRLRALIDGLGLAGRVRLLGFWADPRALYEALDAFALSSLREGLPNVLLEAMAMEVPVVATRIAGVPRLVEDDGNGLLVGPASEGELEAALRRLLDDDALRLRLGRAGRRTVEEDYGFGARIGRIRSIYDELLGAPEGPGGDHIGLGPRSEGPGRDHGDLDP